MMFGKRKQIQRTCRKCKSIWYLPTQLRNVSVQKMPGSFGKCFMSAVQVSQLANENALALSVTRCSTCGVSSYKDKDVYI